MHSRKFLCIMSNGGVSKCRNSEVEHSDDEMLRTYETALQVRNKNIDS